MLSAFQPCRRVPTDCWQTPTLRLLNPYNNRLLRWQEICSGNGMAYDGEILDGCYSHLFRGKDYHVVIVSGSRWNPCGHALLNFGGESGYYAHVSGSVYAYPKYMNHEGYLRYLKENDKREIKRRAVAVPYPDRAFAKFEQLLAEKWFWKVLPDNCVSFVEEILEAGGAQFDMLIHCPRLLTKAIVQKGARYA